MMTAIDLGGFVAVAAFSLASTLDSSLEHLEVASQACSAACYDAMTSLFAVKVDPRVASISMEEYNQEVVVVIVMTKIVVD